MRCLSNQSYKTGSRKDSVRIVELNRPPITTVASGRCTSAPVDVAVAIGSVLCGEHDVAEVLRSLGAPSPEHGVHLGCMLDIAASEIGIVLFHAGGHVVQGKAVLRQLRRIHHDVTKLPPEGHSGAVDNVTRCGRIYPARYSRFERREK